MRASAFIITFHQFVFHLHRSEVWREAREHFITEADTTKLLDDALLA
jgi:hypothetical protein